MTDKLYNDNVMLKECTATVLACEEKDGKFFIELDRTVIFPEGGGQPADLGEIAGVPVTDVRFDDEVIIHMLKKPVPTGPYTCGK